MTDSQHALEVLLSVTRRLTEGMDLEASLSVVTEAALALLPGDHASIRLLDDSRTQLLCGARSGIGAESRPVTYSSGQGVVGWVVDSGQIALVNDVNADTRFVMRRAQGFEVGSLLVVPLWSAGKVVGALAVSAPQTQAFDDEHRLRACLLANCVAPVIERARLERLAVTDPQTRAFNRRYLAPRLREEMARADRSRSKLSMLLMDLDHFKRVNDEHGHAAGDRVLRDFAERVREETRRPDILVRWGGEEFVLVMPETNADEALRVAERIRSATAEDPFELDRAPPRPQTVSIGVVTWDGRESPAELERRADEAMYAAKRAGRNRVVAG